MQSKVVLLVHLCTQNQLDSDEIKNISETVNKAARWLKKMSSHDPSSSRALRVCQDLISRHGPERRLGLDLEDWLSVSCGLEGRTLAGFGMANC
jgi:hypothetical protein